MCRAPCFMALVLYVFYTSRVEGCPEDWDYFEGKCYRWFTEKVNWLEAQMRCKKEGANLVQVDSAGENEWLADNYKSEIIWLGGLNGAEEGTWRWMATGEKIAYSNWANREPNDAGKKEDCLHMHFHHFKAKQAPGNWNDIPCWYKYSYVCEKCSAEAHRNWTGISIEISGL